MGLEHKLEKKRDDYLLFLQEFQEDAIELSEYIDNSTKPYDELTRIKEKNENQILKLHANLNQNNLKYKLECLEKENGELEEKIKIATQKEEYIEMMSNLRSISKKVFFYNCFVSKKNILHAYIQRNGTSEGSSN